MRGMAYPYGRFNDMVVDILRQAGVAYARTTISSESFEIPTDWLRLQPTCHHNNARLMTLAEEFMTGNAQKAPWLFYLWGHTFEFDRDNNWNKIKKFIEYVGNNEEIWYASNIEIYDYVKAYKQLIYSMNGTRVYNPAAAPLYFETGHTTYCVQAGETKEITPSIWELPGLETNA